MDNNQQDQTQDTEEKKDRTTEQFAKLTEHNSSLKEENDQAKTQIDQLKEENEKYKKLYSAPTNQTPDATSYSHLNQNQIDDVFAGMMDQNGFLDGNKLSKTLNEMNQKTIQAEQRAKLAEQQHKDLTQRFNERSEREAQDKVYSKYPQLNPDNKEGFDPKMWRAVYNELAVKAKIGQNPTDSDYMEAADRVHADFYADSEMTNKEKIQKEEKEQTKQQINAIRPVSNTQAGFYADSDDNRLLSDVQQGKRGALAEMLKRRGQ